MSTPLTSVRAKLQIALDASPDPVYVIDIDTLRFIDVNELSCKALGYDRQELLTMSIPDVSQDVTSDRVRSNMKKLEEAGHPIVVEGRHRRKDGTNFPVEVSMHYFEAPEGRFMIATARDLTQRLTDREDRRADEARFRAALDSSADAIFLIDRKTMRFVDANATACQSIGRTMDELLSMGPQDIKPEFTREQLEAKFDEVITGKKKTGVIRTVHRCKEGHEFPVEVFLRWYDGPGDPIMIASVRDRSEFESALHASHDPVYVVSLDEFRILAVNEQATKTVGYTSGELTSMSISELSVHVDKNAFNGVKAELEENGEKVFQTIHRRKDGSEFRVEVHARLSQTPTGPVAICTALDLAEHEEWFRALFEQSPVAVGVSRGGVSLKVNDAYVRFFGYESREDVVGESVLDHLAPESHDKIEDRIANFPADSDEYETIEVVALRPDGTKFPILATIGRIALPDGPAFIGFFTDITERKRAEEDLQRLVAIVKHSHDFIGISDIEGHTLFLNDAGRKLVGIRDDEHFYSTMVPDYFPDADRETVINEIIPTIMDSGHWAGEINFRHFGTGEQIPVWFDIFRIDDPITGEPINFATVTQDIRERKQREEELKLLNESLEQRVKERTLEVRESEERFRAISEASPISILITDLEGGVTYANEAYLDLMQAPFEQIRGWGWASFIHPDNVDALLREWKDYLSLGGNRFENEHKIVRANGDVAWLYCVAAPLVNKDVTDGHVVLLMDETEKRLSQGETVQAKEEAERANAAKDEFLSRVSHEFRTPLNSILGFAQVMDMDEQKGENAESIKQILDAGKHLLSLVDEVLDIAQIESGDLRLNVQTVDLYQHLDDCVHLLAPLTDEKQVKVTLEKPDVRDQYISADPMRLNQVLINVLSNAIKYNKHSGTIKISISRQKGGNTTVEVVDTGAGIHADKIDRVFAPFDRLGAEATTVSGTGIGLALTASLMTAMGGEIVLTSELGQGTTVTLTFPTVSAEEASTTDAADKQGVKEDEAQRKILNVHLVEDDESSIKLMQTFFKKLEGCTLWLSECAADVIEKANSDPPDLFVLDVNLPDSSGTDLLDKIRSMPQLEGVPVVIISADANLSTIDAFKALGVLAYLTKPVDITRLRAVIESLQKSSTESA